MGTGGLGGSKFIYLNVHFRCPTIQFHHQFYCSSALTAIVYSWKTELQLNLKIIVFRNRCPPLHSISQICTFNFVKSSWLLFGVVYLLLVLKSDRLSMVLLQFVEMNFLPILSQVSGLLPKVRYYLTCFSQNTFHVVHHSSILYLIVWIVFLKSYLLLSGLYFLLFFLLVLVLAYLFLTIFNLLL